MKTPTFYEFFAGGGMARAGLGDGWRCVFANDIDAKKRDAYVANWGPTNFLLNDINDLRPDDLHEDADLAWASFPCQDLSLAGNGAGLAGERSGTFWAFWNLMAGLVAQGRAPRILVLENVIGALSSNGGGDFQEICRALTALGYCYGAMTIDAAHFVPQSRPRLFIVAARDDIPLADALLDGGPSPHWANAALRRAYAMLRPDLKKSWRWWRLPQAPLSNTRLADLIEDEPADVEWHGREETQKLLSLMSEANLAKVEVAKASDTKQVGTIYRRTRLDENGVKRQRAEVRFDDVAGCLRTPGGGSSRQFIMAVEGAKVRSRLLSGREAARLMGLPDDYKLPVKYNDAYHLLGDGLVVPVISYLRDELIELLLASCSVKYAIAAE